MAHNTEEKRIAADILIAALGSTNTPSLKISESDKENTQKRVDMLADAFKTIFKAVSKPD